jgi:hypothetical protein
VIRADCHWHALGNGNRSAQDHVRLSSQQLTLAPLPAKSPTCLDLLVRGGGPDAPRFAAWRESRERGEEPRNRRVGDEIRNAQAIHQKDGRSTHFAKAIRAPQPGIQGTARMGMADEPEASGLQPRFLANHVQLLGPP